MSEIDLFGLGKVAGSMSEPVKLLLSRLLESPIIDISSEIIKDELTFYRWRRLVNMADRARKFLDSRGIEPNSYHEVPIKTLLPIMELGSLEDDDTLQDKWAKLLASAVAGETIHPSYTKILSEISKNEALMLDYLKKPTEKYSQLSLDLRSMRQEKPDLLRASVSSESNREAYKIYQELSEERKEISKAFSLAMIRECISIDETELRACIDNLTRLRLCEHPEDFSIIEVVTDATFDDGDIDLDYREIEEFSINYRAINLTTLGINFVKICQGDF